VRAAAGGLLRHLEGRCPAVSPKLASSGNTTAKSTRIGVAVLVVLALAAILGLQAWSNRTVEVSVNDTNVSIKAGSSLDALVSAAGLQLTPGNFMSIGGNVITEGAVTPTRQPSTVPPSRRTPSPTTTVSDGQSYEFSDGADTTEACEEQVVDMQPKLEVQGTAGAITYVAQWGKTGKKRVKVGRDIGKRPWTTESWMPARMPSSSSTTSTSMTTTSSSPSPLNDGPSQYTQRYLDILCAVWCQGDVL